MAVVGSTRDLLALVDDGDCFVDLELGAFDEVGEVRLEEGQVVVASDVGVHYRTVLRCRLA